MAKKDKKSDVNFEIVESYGFLDKEETKLYAKVRWFDNEAKDMVSRVYRLKDHPDEIRLGKGIELTLEDIEALANLAKKHPKPVDFKEIFESSIGIMDKREAGHTTKDGYIVLRVRPGGPYDRWLKEHH